MGFVADGPAAWSSSIATLGLLAAEIEIKKPIRSALHTESLTSAVPNNARAAVIRPNKE